MTTRYLSSMIRSRHKLLPLAYEFNTLPARYIHASRAGRYAGVDGAAFAGLIQSRRAERMLSGRILGNAGLSERFHWDFEPAGFRLALVNGPDLLSLVQLAGIAVNAQQIAGVIQRAPLLALKKSIGAGAYLFALKKAPFLIGRTRFPFVREQTEFSGFKDYAAACGIRLLATCLSNAPEALTMRLNLKLPAEIKGISGSHYPDDEGEVAFRVLKKILIQEVDSQWAPFIS